MDRPTISVPGIDIGCAWPVRELVLMCWCLRKWVSVSGHPVHCQWSRGECALIRRRFSRRKDTQKKRPRFYRVMLHNDSYNRREYVVQVLMKTIPGMTVDDAVNIMQARACSPQCTALQPCLRPASGGEVWGRRFCVTCCPLHGAFLHKVPTAVLKHTIP